jgi:hypothetical protein
LDLERKRLTLLSGDFELFCQFIQLRCQFNSSNCLSVKLRLIRISLFGKLGNLTFLYLDGLSELALLCFDRLSELTLHRFGSFGKLTFLLFDSLGKLIDLVPIF